MARTKRSSAAKAAARALRSEERAQRRAQAMKTGEGQLSAADVAALIGIGPVTLWRWSRCGRFPSGRLLPGSRLRRWSASEVRAWLDGRGIQEPAAAAPAATVTA